MHTQPFSFRSLSAAFLALALTLAFVPGAAATEEPLKADLPNAFIRSGETGEVQMLLGGPYLTEPSNAAAEAIALAFVEENQDLFGLTSGQVEQLVVKSSYGTAQNGAQHVTLSQEIDGHQVEFTGLTFLIDREGRIISVGGPLARGLASGDAKLDAMDAIQAAGAAAGLDLPDSLPAESGEGDEEQFENTFAITVDPNPVTAELVWFPSPDGEELTLAWETDFEVDADTWLQTFVDAETGDILHQGNRYVDAGPEGTVFTGQHPDDSPPRAVTPFTGIGGSWVTDRVTSGNNVNAYRDLNNTNTVGYQPQTPASPDPGFQHFNYTWTDAWRTNADDSNASLNADLDAAVTQLFYYTNVMHDWLYGFGFDEPSGNFQVDNFGLGGVAGDPVLAEAQDGWNFGCLASDGVTPVRCANNANFGFSSDGTSPRMQMYMWSPSQPPFTRPHREGSMDGDVIAHEYGHGVSDRLVGGGGSSLGYNTHLVHASLGEGWSDIVSFLKWGDAVVGEYDTGNATTGIRRVAYETSDHTYSDYNPLASSGHPNGEVWATMVYDIREALGINTTAQLVVDGLKATPALPTFLDARDAIIAADTATNGGANYCLLWGIFARNGLGTGATFSKPSTTPPADDFTATPECVPNADADGPYLTSEGTSITLDGSGSTPSSDPSGGPIVSYEWDFDNNGQYDDATGVSPIFGNVGDNNVFAIGLRVTNAAGVSGEDTTTVTVTNLPPTVILDGVSPTTENVAITLDGLVTDPGWLDTFTTTVDWDDGLGPQPLSGTTENLPPNATMIFSESHTYGDNGTFNIEVCATDDDGAVDCATTTALVANTPPTAVITEDVYFAHAGDTLTVTANSTDPGSDDLEATWTWGDGDTSVFTSLVNPPFTDPPKSPTIQPRDVDWTAEHVYAEACLYDLGLQVVDDDSGSATDTAVVVITGNADLARGSGWWMNQYRTKPPNEFSEAELLCYLEIVKFMSTVFDEERAPLDTRDDAVDVLFVKQNLGTPSELFDEQLLMAWLNFANGFYSLDTLVDTDGNGIPDSTFGLVVYAAETVRLDPTATSEQLLAQKDILESLFGG
jgi:Zn-dependent metalloprotease